jgi:hypothetical protein
MTSAQHAVLLFSPHTFLHTNETHQPHHHAKMMDEDEAAAALCALPSTSAKVDSKAFQHIWAQIKDCSDRLRDLTSIATVTAAASATPETAPSSAPALFPLLQQLLSLFHTFNSSVQPEPQQQQQSTTSTVVLQLKKRKIEQPDDSNGIATTIIKRECDDKGDESESNTGDCGHRQGPTKRQKRARRSKVKSELTNLRCFHCGETDTPEWRRGPAGPKTLCNACGLQYAKYLREADKREKCRLPLSLVLNS